MADKAKPKKLAIVFDMDETLGYFTQIGFVIEQYENFTNKIVTIEEAMDVLDCYPNIFRPGIYSDFIDYWIQEVYALPHKKSIPHDDSF